MGREGKELIIHYKGIRGRRYVRGDFQKISRIVKSSLF